MASGRVVNEGVPVAIGAGVESISLVQMQGINLNHFVEEDLIMLTPGHWMPMIETADVVAAL